MLLFFEIIFCFLDGIHEGLQWHPNNKADIHKSSSNDDADALGAPLGWQQCLQCTLYNNEPMLYASIYSPHFQHAGLCFSKILIHVHCFI